MAEGSPSGGWKEVYDTMGVDSSLEGGTEPEDILDIAGAEDPNTYSGRDQLPEFEDTDMVGWAAYQIAQDLGEKNEDRYLHVIPVEDGVEVNTYRIDVGDEIYMDPVTSPRFDSVPDEAKKLRIQFTPRLDSEYVEILGEGLNTPIVISPNNAGEFRAYQEDVIDRKL